MTDATADLSHAPLTTADGRPLKAALAESLAVRRRRALLLVAPLFLYIQISFIVPIGQMLFKSVYNDGFSAHVPALSAWFDANPPGSAIDEAAYAALHADLVAMKRNKTAGEAAERIARQTFGSAHFLSSLRKASL